MEKRGWLTVLLVFGGLFITLLLFSVVLLLAFQPDGEFGVSGKRVGVIKVSGPITSSKEFVGDLRDFADKGNIGGIVIRVDSPGGAVAPSQEMYQAVKRVEQNSDKPIAVSMGNTAASGGYYIACGADKIFANPGTVTGSIGVITQLFNVKDVMKALKIDVHTIKTGEFKDAGSPFKKLSDKDREYFRQLLADIYDQFVSAVAESRDLSTAEVEQLADGRVFSGKQAQKNGLVDEMGTLWDTAEWVKKQAGIEGKLKLKYPPEEGVGIWGDMVKSVSDQVQREVKQSSTPVFEYRLAAPTN
jgi:protease-4